VAAIGIVEATCVRHQAAVEKSCVWQQRSCRTPTCGSSRHGGGGRLRARSDGVVAAA
jgi:hypothetical protein